MKKKIRFMLMLLMLISISFVCTGCYSDETILELYNKIDEIEKHPNYAILYSEGYISSTENISFEDLIKAKLKSDNKRIDNTDIGFKRHEQNIVRFVWKYKTQERVWGLNDENNYYAIGTISTIDYSISIQYFTCKYEIIDSIDISNTHFVLGMADKDNEISENVYASKIITISRINGGKKEYNGKDNYMDSIGELIPIYKSPTSYTENGIQYNVGGSLYHDENGRNEWIHAPRLVEVYQKHKELTKLYNILYNNEISYGVGVEGTFITNGDELFVVFSAEHGMFGYESAMQFPVIYKCDSSLENFEYVGCVYSPNHSYFYDIEIIKIK